MSNAIESKQLKNNAVQKEASEINRYRLVIFDLDGTLLDTLPDLAAAVNHALTTHKRSARSIDEVRRFISNGVRKLIARALFITSKSKDNDDYVIGDERLYEAVFGDFVKYYLEHVSDHTGVYGGMPRLVSELKRRGIMTAVVTNKREDAAVRLMDRFFPDCFTYVYGDGPDRQRKPSPDSVIKIMEQLGVEKQEAVYVGDSDVDLLTAYNAGIDSILVTWGYRSRPFLVDAGGRVIVDTPQELEMMIC